VLKVILDLDENMEDGRLNWGDISDNSDFNFGDISLSMRSCI
jgi:hypothetical protein